VALFVTDLFQVVRDIADTDSTELTDSVARSYLFRGYDELIARQGDWKHFEVEATFNTVSGQRDYTFASILATGLADITLVTDDTNYGYDLRWIDYEDARRIWHGPTDIASNPAWWSVRYTAGAAKLNLWPKPSGVRAMTINGYRTENTWKTLAVSTPTTTNPDLPSRLQDTLVDYVLSCWYDQQEDLQMAEKYRQKHEMAVEKIMADEQRSTQARPLIMSGGRQPAMNEKRWREGLNHLLP
jgi:hypothetical protein